MASGDIAWTGVGLRVEHTGDTRTHPSTTLTAGVGNDEEPAASAIPSTAGAVVGRFVLGHWGTGIGYTINPPVGIGFSFRCRLMAAVYNGSAWRGLYADTLANGYRPTGRIRAARTSSDTVNGAYEWENEATVTIELIKVATLDNDDLFPAGAIGALVWVPLIL